MLDIIKRIGIDEAKFRQSLQYFGQDQQKQMKLMEVEQNMTASGGGDNDYETLTRDKVIEVFKVQMDIQMEQMRKMFEDPNLKNDASQMT